MTQMNRKHQAAVFFPLPDGNGLLHTFIGTAEPPKQVVLPTRDVPCKTKHIEILSITNWLKKRQRFRVQIEIVKSDGGRSVGSGQRPGTVMENTDPAKPVKEATATAVTGPDYIDVPASEKRDYSLNFFAHKEGMVQAKAFFRNEVSGEFLVYLINFKATAAGTIDSINLTTSVRKVFRIFGSLIG